MIQRIKNWCIESLGGHTEEEYRWKLDGLALRVGAVEAELAKEDARRRRGVETVRVETVVSQYSSIVPKETIERSLLQELGASMKRYARFAERPAERLPGVFIYSAEITVVTGGNHE